MLTKVEADRLQYHDIVVTGRLRRLVRYIEACPSFPVSLHVSWKDRGGTLCVRSDEMLTISNKQKDRP